MKKVLIYTACVLTLLPTACRRADVPAAQPLPENAICVEAVTKADAAETIPWLEDALKEGLDITYGLNKDRANTERVSVLQLKDDNTYSFLYKDTGTPGVWMGNGAHFFEGEYIPYGLTTGVDLTKDQRDYTALSRYLSLPPNFTLNATVGRITLPLRHRLARVLAYILIDPSLGSDVKIEGYTLPDEPETSKIRFCNVKVLSGVDGSTPRWTTARKVIPHFVGELEVDAAALAAFNDGIVYGKVPVYDLIVEPTYTAAKNVMYDEDFSARSKDAYYAATNKIDFEVTLNNGLQYTKEFIFDLDANYETIVYLRIGRKSVDYNSSGSELWVETVGHDAYYGTNNQNGNNLSFAGGSWQRAFTNASFTGGVTDGHAYQQDGEDAHAQYVDDATWIELFAQAHEGGARHGDYFILAKDLSIPASALPDGFVFTGHLDGLDHTLTISGVEDGGYAFAGLNGHYTTAQETSGIPDGEANVHLEKGHWVPYCTATDGWRAELLNTKFVLSEGAVIDPATVSGYLHNCFLNGVRLPDYTPSLPEY